MPYFTIYSHKLAIREFIYARNMTHAFETFRKVHADPEACLEDGFDFSRTYNEEGGLWKELEDPTDWPTKVDLLEMRVNYRELSCDEATRAIDEAIRKYGIDPGLDRRGGQVLVDIEVLPQIWQKFFVQHVEDIPQAERDQRDQNKVYQAHNLRGLAAIIQKQLDAGRGQWQIRRASDPTIKPETVMSDPEGVSVKIGDGVIWIDHYQAE